MFIILECVVGGWNISVEEMEPLSYRSTKTLSSEQMWYLKKITTTQLKICKFVEKQGTGVTVRMDQLYFMFQVKEHYNLENTHICIYTASRPKILAGNVMQSYTVILFKLSGGVI